MADAGRYLYAVIDDPTPRTLGPIGVDGAVVYTVPGGAVAAVVSDVPNRKIRPERRKVAAHFQVLKVLMAERTPLPVAFGVIADGPGGVEDLLARNQDGFTAQLARVRGHAEMGLKIAWAVPNIFEYVLAGEPDLRAFRDRLFAAGGTPGTDAKMELGRRFERAIADRRERAAAVVRAELAPTVSDVKEEAPKGETEVLNLACLVPADAVAAFEAAVTRAAARFGDEYAFALSGPWPPHNFVQPGLGL
jgi:hypothetical protein